MEDSPMLSSSSSSSRPHHPYSRPSTSLASLSRSHAPAALRQPRRHDNAACGDDTDTDVIDNRNGHLAAQVQVDCEKLELRRRQLVPTEGIRGGAHNGAAGIDARTSSRSSAPSDEHLGHLGHLGAGRRNQRSQLPPRYAPKGHGHTSDRSPKGVADAHPRPSGGGRQQPMNPRHYRRTPHGHGHGPSAPPLALDATEADFDELKSRTLLQAFDRMKRDERLASIGANANANANANADSGANVSEHRRPDPEACCYEDADAGAGAGAGAGSGAGAYVHGDNTRNNKHHGRNRQPDETVRSIERTLAEIRTKRRTRQQYDGVTGKKIDAPEEVEAEAEIEVEVEEIAKAAMTTRTTTPIATATAVRNDRPRRREKEPSPSPSGRYGAISPPPPPEDGLDSDEGDVNDVGGRRLLAGDDTADPITTTNAAAAAAAATTASARGDFDLSTSRAIAATGRTSGSDRDFDYFGGQRNKPMDRVMSKHAVAAADHSLPLPATSILAGDVVADDEHEHQSLVSTLPSLGTEGHTEDDTLDDDHYFRQDAALNPPTTPVRATTRSLSRSERLAFHQKTEEVQMAQRVSSTDVDEQQNTSGGDAFLAQTRSDAYVLAGAWSPSAHPKSIGGEADGMSRAIDPWRKTKLANQVHRPPNLPSPLSEFLQVKKELASMPQIEMVSSSASKTITTLSPDAIGKGYQDDVSAVGRTVYRNRRGETQKNIPIGTTEDEDRVLNAHKNTEGRPPLSVSEEQAAMDEYVKQLRARLPQAGKSGGIASKTGPNTCALNRDMRKKINRLRGAPPANSSQTIGTSTMSNRQMGAANVEEDTSFLSEGISTMEKQIAEITSREGAGPDPSSSSSSSSESSSSQVAECVRDISPPPTPIRDIRRRERLEMEMSRDARKTTGGGIGKLQRKSYEEDTIFDSLPSTPKDFARGNADESVATEDDNGLLHFMATSSVPSISPNASPQGEGLSTKADSSSSNRSASGAASALVALSDVPENHRRRDKDDSRSSNSADSESTSASASVSDDGFNHYINKRGASTRQAAAPRVTKGPQKKYSAEDRAANRDRWAHRRTKSGHSSFSQGDFSTPSDEHREYRRDEIFSGAYSGGTTSRGPKRTERRTITENGDLESLNLTAAQHVERGQYERALEAFNMILDSHTARYGEIHPFVASTMHNMAIVHSKNAKSQTDPRDVEKSNKEALLCFQNAARIARDALGSDHPNVAVSLVRLGGILLGMEQFENALVTFSEALRVRVASLGPDHALCSKIQNNIGVTCLQMKRFADAGEAFHSALKIQRNVYSRLSIDCQKGQVRQDFLQRAKLELADTLCNIASLNLDWAETETTNKEVFLLDESISAFAEALDIRLEEFGTPHPKTQKTKIMLEKAREAHAAAEKRSEAKTSKPIVGGTSKSRPKRLLDTSVLSKAIPSDPPATRGLFVDDDNSLAENSVLTSLCSPGQMDVCGLGGLYSTASSRMPKAKIDVEGPNCCPTNETTAVWVAPHCILPPDERRKTDPLFSDNAPFKSILGWPEEREKTVEDLFTSEGITIPGAESVGSSITMEKVKTASNNDEEESVMITTLARSLDDEEELPAPDIGATLGIKDLDGGSKKEEKKKKSRRGLMLIRPSLRRNKSSRTDEQTASAPTTNRKSILRRRSKRTNVGPTEIQDIDGGRAASWKQPSRKEVETMLKNPEENITALYAVGASHLNRNEYSEAESIFRTLLEHHRKKHSEVHPYVGSAMHNLGIVLLQAERYEEALAAFEDAVRVRKMMSTKRGSVDVAVSLVKVGISSLLLKRFELALESFTEALSIRRRALGELHPSVGRVYNNIGCVNCELNQLKEACGAFEASLEVQRHALSASVDVDNGPLQLGMSTTLSNLGYLYKSQGRHVKSVAALKEALVLQESVLGKHHPTVLSTLDSLAEASARINESQDAIRHYNSCLIRYNAWAKSGQMSSEQRRGSAIVLFKISRVHLKQKDFDASHRKLKEAKFSSNLIDRPSRIPIFAQMDPFTKHFNRRQHRHIRKNYLVDLHEQDYK
eukprot:CAMPEP_0181036952 /NCGR_PEP_ID=MMETSP1070-20121207/9141_1 /TAXON_ID=265543 /ORGANISM="Minutocellus polymorphus, Strain NH13" /LENGTH=2032 /DNA_ID=CAMNT_0023114633 /DNA_START=338 /DNA_END=6437 /DNA_ORIENTATION=+